MSRLEFTTAQKIETANRVVLVGLPVWLTYLSLGHFQARLPALVVGIGLGAPVAWVVVRLADGWGLDDADRSGSDRSGDASTSE